MSIIAELLEREAAELFREARSIGGSKEIRFSSTNIISASCMMKPPCRHCEWKSNQQFTTGAGKRKSKKDFIEHGRRVERMGVNRIVVPSGWVQYDLPDYFYEYLEELIGNVNIEVEVAFGAINRQSLQRLKSVGVGRYSCGIETTNQKVFQYVRPGDSFDNRIKTLRMAKELGMKIDSSLLFGVGETIGDIAEGIKLMKELEVDSAAVWPLSPSPYTEMEKWDTPNSFMMARILAVMVINLKESDIVGDTRPGNLKWGIRAGANAFSVSSRQAMEKIKNMREGLLKNTRVG